METTEQKPDKKNRIFYIVMFSLIILSVAVTFVKIVILKDYQIVSQVSCDPKIEKCFMSVCDPASDDTCSSASSTAERTTYYKNISKKAETIYLCEQTTEKIGCNEELACIEGEKDCTYSYCNPSTLAEGEQCAE